MQRQRIPPAIAGRTAVEGVSCSPTGLRTSSSKSICVLRVQSLLTLSAMSEQNLPYILELAGMAAMSDDSASTIELAVKNGIPRDQFERAVEVMKRIKRPQEFVQQVYLVDGWVRGYTDLDETPTAWILGQQAHAYYDLGKAD